MAAPKIKTGTGSSGNSNGDAKALAFRPFSVQITKAEGQPLHSGMIVKLVEIGFLMKVNDDHLYKVGEEYQIYFVLPEIEKSIRTIVKVIKTYDGLEAMSKATAKVRTVEMHFKALADADRTNLNSYLVKMGLRK